MNELVSIVVPLYNYANYIGELIASVLSQDYSNWELIIVDDCSTDDPKTVVEQYKDDRISFIRLETNCGYATAKNEGIIKSTGEFIVVLDADDLLAPHSISSRVNFLNIKPKFSWIHAKAYEFQNDINKSWWKKRKFIRRFLSMRKSGNYKGVWNCIHAQTVMARRSCYLKVGLYEESMRSMSDKEMWARFENNIGIPGYLDKFVVYYRMHGRQMHRSVEKKKNLKKLLRTLSSCIKNRKKGNFSSVRKLLK